MGRVVPESLPDFADDVGQVLLDERIGPEAILKRALRRRLLPMGDEAARTPSATVARGRLDA